MLDTNLGREWRERLGRDETIANALAWDYCKITRLTSREMAECKQTTISFFFFFFLAILVIWVKFAVLVEPFQTQIWQLFTWLQILRKLLFFAILVIFAIFGVKFVVLVEPFQSQIMALKEPFLVTSLPLNYMYYTKFSYQLFTASFTVCGWAEEHPMDRFSPWPGLCESFECTREPCSAMCFAHRAAALHISRSIVMFGEPCFARNRLCSARPFNSCWENTINWYINRQTLNHSVTRSVDRLVSRSVYTWAPASDSFLDAAGSHSCYGR